MMSFKERFVQFLLLMVTLGGGFTALSLIGNSAFGQALMSGLFAAAGGFGYYRVRQKALRRLMHKREAKVLRLLDDSEGRFSIGKLALKLNYSVDEVEHIVEKLVSKGVIEVATSTGGAVVYYLPQTPSRLTDY